jgi:CRP-like cAMP-binding protein
MMWEGRARYFFETPSGEKVILMWIRQGDVLAATLLVAQPSLYLASAEAVRDSMVLVWDRLKTLVLARRFPQHLGNLLLIATNYFYWYVAAQVGAGFWRALRKDSPTSFFGLAESIGEKASGSVEIDMTNEELASSANSTPYTVSRMISSWERDGLIRKKRGKILVRSPEKLFLRAAGH